MSTERPYPQLRASDAERERVVAFLREHALLGRLSNDELEERIGLAYGAVTVGDLERLIADLPRATRQVAHPARPARPVRTAKRRSGPCPALIVAGVGVLLFTGFPLAILSGIAAVGVALIAIVIGLSFLLGPFLLVALIIVLANRRRRPPPMRWGPQYRSAWLPARGSGEMLARWRLT